MKIEMSPILLSLLLPFQSVAFSILSQVHPNKNLHSRKTRHALRARKSANTAIYTRVS
jgi:hypothetical protein